MTKRKLPQKREPIKRTIVLESEVREEDVTAEKLYQRGLDLIRKDMDRYETTTGLTESQVRNIHGHMRVLGDKLKEDRQREKKAEKEAAALSDDEILAAAAEILKRRDGE